MLILVYFFVLCYSAPFQMTPLPGGEPLALLQTRSVMPCSFVATTEAVESFNTSSGVREGLRVYDIGNLMNTAGAFPGAFAMIDDASTGVVWAIVGDDLGGLSFSSLQSCTDTNFVLNADLYVQYNGSKFIASGAGAEKNEVVFFSHDKVVQIGFVQGINGQILGVKSVSEICDLQHVVGYGASSAGDGSHWIQSRNTGYLLKDAMAFPALNTSSVTGFQSFRLQYPVLGHAWGGSLFASLTPSIPGVLQYPAGALNFVPPAVDPRPFVQMTVHEWIYHEYTTALSQASMRIGAETYVVVLSQGTFPYGQPHRLNFILLYREDGSGGTFPTPILKLTHEIDFADDIYGHFRPVNLSIFYEQPPNGGNQTGGFLSVIMQSWETKELGIFDFQFSSTMFNTTENKLVVSAPSQDRCYISQATPQKICPTQTCQFVPYGTALFNDQSSSVCGGKQIC
jgi:hypothetical protein